MGNALIDKELIGEPRLYDLAMRLEAETLHVLLYRSGEPESIVYRAVPLDAPGLPPERRLEETVYNNPLLLSDFHKVTILVDTTRYAIIPDNATGGDTLFAEVLADRMLPDTADDSRAETLFTPMSPAGVTVAVKMPSQLLAFLRRTFNNPAIYPPIAPLSRYFYDSSLIGHSGKIYVNIRRDSLDLLAFTGSRLELANTFAFRESADAIYYIMSVRKMLMDRDGDDRELLIAGDDALRDEITAVLREYAGYVMPVVYPATLVRAPKDVLKSPFDLIITPQCE